MAQDDSIASLSSSILMFGPSGDSKNRAYRVIKMQINH